MAKYANQMTIKIAKRAPRNKDNIYSTMNIDAMKEAMNNLKGESLKLWLYLNKNQENYQLDLSQKALEEWGLKKDSYYTAKNKLIELGYLEHDKNNTYYFHEKLPASKKTNEAFSENPNFIF